MQLEEVQLAIRPRTILECLDLTFLFCSRHWLGLFLTASMGILPLASFNWWAARLPEMPGLGVAMLLAMEVPWATVFVTLYLGQATFSPKLSIVRLLRDGFRAIPALVLLQVVVRGACLAVIVLIPVVVFGMYYLNEIILLEKTPLLRIWNRRTAMNARIMSRIVSLRLMDLMVLMCGTFALRALFRAITSLWEDRVDSLEWMIIDTDTEFGPHLVIDWQLHAAFWVVIVFQTVYRFVSYLDCRIRREGWDVELKLRAQAAVYRQREETA